ncbi:MAG: AAA domain-containing protein [Patescibacteria group bacterium]
MILKNARDILMVNTPAINSFKFENVLTTPRACQIKNSTRHLQQIEQFLQAYYKNTEEVLLRPNFKKLVAKDLPTINYRIGLQLLDDDRKILDYSELITNLDEGAGQMFVSLIQDYVEGNVENTTDEIHKSYKKEYPKKSVRKIVDDVPIKLNDSQRRVLLASKNEKNKIIKVEGPPGTGKSYTITALVYLANLMGKSILISSHKKQALDVVEEKLTQQFKKLHPRAKPAIMRLTTKSNLGETPNNIESTLSSAAINSASDRALNFNKEAIEKDKETLLEKIKEENSTFWDNAESYTDYLETSLEYLQLEKQLFGNQIKLAKVQADSNLSNLTEKRTKFKNFTSAPQITWGNFRELFSDRETLETLIEKCDRLNGLQSGDVLPKEFVELDLNNLEELNKIVKELEAECQKDIPLKSFLFDEVDKNEVNSVNFEFSIDFSEVQKAKKLLSELIEASRGLKNKLWGSKQKKELENSLKIDFPHIFKVVKRDGVEKVYNKIAKNIDSVEALNKKYSFLSKDFLLTGHEEVQISSLKESYDQLQSLKFQKLLSAVAKDLEKPESQLTLEQISTTLHRIQQAKQYYTLKDELDSICTLLNIEKEDLQQLYQSLQDIKNVMSALDDKFIENTNELLESYEPALKLLGIEKQDITSLNKLSNTSEEIALFWKFVRLHEKISNYDLATPPEREKIALFEEKVQKLLEHENDQRLKSLNNYSGDIQRALTAVNTGKRLSEEQAKVLFDNLSCIIAPPKLISEYFPMNKDMVDMLIIDEASQVSIAESISLMLRAKQTIVFGDELQYGAVSARNVSKKYSERYFKDILDDYEKDKNDPISDEVKDRLASEVSEDIPEEELTSSPTYTVDPNQKEWLKTFGIRTSTLSFAEAVANYKTSLDVHFRSFPEIISYSSEKFYKENQINLITNRIRTKPIGQVLRFIKVDTQGMAGRNVNLDEMEAIKEDLENVLHNGFKGTIGIICSFREQAERMDAFFREELSSYHQLKKDHELEIWFVGDVQGVERDIVYFSLVEDKELGNASLKYIYPVVGGTADNIHNLQKQRLNVGFSRAKDTMVFVHSMTLGKYADTSLGEALDHYQKIAETTTDNYVEDESVFDSPAEKKLYNLLIQTDFYKQNRNSIRIIPQFDMGKYINDKYHKYIPNYRVDFLVTLSEGGKERSLIMEYDGIEYHFKNPDEVTKHNFEQEYVEYDIQRQLELEQYGYSFLRVNKFNLMPENEGQTEVDMLNKMLERSFN